jgi:hypothetical protein
VPFGSLAARFQYLQLNYWREFHSLERLATHGVDKLTAFISTAITSKDFN